MKEARPQLCACGCGGQTSGKFNHHSGQYARFIIGHHNRLPENRAATRLGQQRGMKKGSYRKSPEWRVQAAELKRGMRNPMHGNVAHMRAIASLPGARNPNFGKPPAHGFGQWFVDRKGRRMWLRSTWEVAIAQWLDTRNLTWKYEKERFNLGVRTYVPDFWIEEFGCFWEIKGWFHTRHQETIRLFRDLYPQHHLIVVTIEIMKMLFGRSFR